MKKIITLAAIIVAFSTSSAVAQSSEKSKRDYSPVKSSPGASKASYDIQFLDTMIAHHLQGIQMSEMAEDKSQNVDVKAKAEALISELESEVSKLESVRTDIQEKAPEAVNTSLSGMSSQDVKGLYDKTAKDFDKKYLKMNISHTEGGLTMSRDAIKKAKNAKVKEVATELSTKQSGRLAELKELLKKLDN